MLLLIMSSLQEECESLKEAAMYGDVDDIKMLASSGVDVNAVVDYGEVSDLTRYTESLNCMMHLQWD